MGCLIYRDAAVLNRLIICNLISSPENCFNSGNQYLWAERLGYVFIYTKFKSLKFIPFIASGCQHNDWNLGISSYLSAHLPSVHLGHHDIQNNQRNVLIVKEYIKSFAAVSCFQNCKILFFQEITHQFSHSALIIYYQYL